MVPTAVLELLTTNTIAMAITTSNNHSTSNTINISVESPFCFGVFQVTTIGNSDLTIRAIVPPTISAQPYRKVKIIILFFVVSFLSLLLLLFLLAI